MLQPFSSLMAFVLPEETPSWVEAVASESKARRAAGWPVTMSQEDADGLERPVLEWLHHAGFADLLQNELEDAQHDEPIAIQARLCHCLNLAGDLHKTG